MKTITLILVTMLAATAAVASLVPTAGAHTCRSALNGCGSCWVGEEHEHSWIVAGVELSYCKTVKTDDLLAFIAAAENGYSVLA